MQLLQDVLQLVPALIDLGMVDLEARLGRVLATRLWPYAYEQTWRKLDRSL